jgi:predicted SAM-dependent methyltransferase
MPRTRDVVSRPVTSYARVQSWLGHLLRNRRLQLRKRRVRDLRYLDLGCGRNTNESFVNMDFLWHPEVDLCWDVLQGLPFQDASLRGIFSEHFLEHFDIMEVESILKECRRVLAPGGVLRLVVPDAERYLRTYCLQVSGSLNARFPFQERESMDGDFAAMLSVNRVFYQDRDSPHGHRVMFDFQLLDLLLRRAGFDAITRTRFREGRDLTLLVESEARAVESLYVEACVGGGSRC